MSDDSERAFRRQGACVDEDALSGSEEKENDATKLSENVISNQFVAHTHHLNGAGSAEFGRTRPRLLARTTASKPPVVDSGGSLIPSAHIQKKDKVAAPVSISNGFLEGRRGRNATQQQRVRENSSRRYDHFGQKKASNSFEEGSGRLSRKAASTTSLPVAPALDTLTDEAIFRLTRSNTKKNAARPLKQRFARVRQTLEALATPNPQLLEALPLVQPEELEEREEKIPSKDGTERGSASSEERSDTSLADPLKLERASSNLDSLDFEAASIHSLENMDSIKSSSFPRANSVRISTSVTIVQRQNAKDSVVRHYRNEHPDRSTARALTPRRAMYADNSAPVRISREGETPAQARRRRLAGAAGDGGSSTLITKNFPGPGEGKPVD